MNLKHNSWHAWLYTTVYTKPLPGNLCDYFWPVLLTSICGLFLWPVYILLRVSDEGWSSYWHLYVGMLFYSMYAALFFTCLSTGEHELDFAANAVTWLHALGFSGGWMFLGYYLLLQGGVAAIAITMAVVIYTVMGIGLLVQWIRSRMPEKEHKPAKKHKPNLLIEFVKAKKNKYCPKIEWM